jgi:hypothetical protein
VWNIDLEKWGTLELEGEKSGEHQLKKLRNAKSGEHLSKSGERKTLSYIV